MGPCMPASAAFISSRSLANAAVTDILYQSMKADCRPADAGCSGVCEGLLPNPADPPGVRQGDDNLQARLLSTCQMRIRRGGKGEKHSPKSLDTVTPRWTLRLKLFSFDAYNSVDIAHAKDVPSSSSMSGSENLGSHGLDRSLHLEHEGEERDQMIFTGTSSLLELTRRAFA